MHLAALLALKRSEPGPRALGEEIPNATASAGTPAALADKCRFTLF